MSKFIMFFLQLGALFLQSTAVELTSLNPADTRFQHKKPPQQLEMAVENWPTQFPALPNFVQFNPFKSSLQRQSLGTLTHHST